MKKRTIDRKNKEGLLSSVAKNLGLKSGSTGNGSAGGSGANGTNGTNGSTGSGSGDSKGEFDDLISALRTGDVFGEDMAKFKRSRKTRLGAVQMRDASNTSPPRQSAHREDSRERTVVTVSSTGRRQ